MSSRLLVLSELGSPGAEVAHELARTRRAALIPAAAKAPDVEPWQWELASVMVDVERSWMQDLPALASVIRVAGQLNAGRDVVWALDDRAPRFVGLVMSVRRLIDRLEPDLRLAATPWLDAAQAVLDHLGSGSAPWVAVVQPDPGTRRRLRAWRDDLGLLGARPAAVIVGAHGTTRDLAPERRRRARRIANLASGWGAASLRLRHADRTALRAVKLSASAVTTREEIERVDDEFHWRVPIRVPRDALDLRIGRIDDDLLVHRGELTRLVPLPAVVARCTVVGARIEGRVLRVRAVPDPSRWRAA